MENVKNYCMYLPLFHCSENTLHSTQLIKITEKKHET